jgi:proline iminopeptidase
MGDTEFTSLWTRVDRLPILFKIDLLHWDTLGKEALKQKILAEGRVFYKEREA